MRKTIISVIMGSFLGLISISGQTVPGAMVGIAKDPAGIGRYLRLNSLGKVITVANTGPGFANNRPGAFTGVALDPDGNRRFLAVDATGALIVDSSGSGGLPDQTGNSGKFLTTNGTAASWATLAGGGDALVANPLSQFAATTSAQLRGVLSDEVGTGAAYFVGGALGTPASGTATNLTGLPIAGITGLGTGVGTALAVNVGSAGAPVVFNGALGTPSSGSAANLTAFPTLNQNTTGSAATLTTARTINGVSFNGSANITVTAAGSTLSDTVPVTKGGTGLTALGTSLQVLRTNSGATAAEWATLSTGGDVTAASSFGTDGLPIVSDGTGKGVKAVSTIAAATITTLTITNPAALGSSTATTQTALDNSTKIATTAYVDTASKASRLGSHSTPNTAAGSITWSTAVYEVFANTTTTYALPAAAGYDGRAVLFYCTGTNAMTIDPNGSEVIVRDGTAQTGGVTLTLTGAAGNYVALMCDGTRWITLGFKGTLAAGS